MISKITLKQRNKNFCKTAATKKVSDQTFVEKSEKQPKSWNKNADEIYSLKSDALKIDDSKKKNENSEKKNKNSSTLSLHIAAYENYIEAGNGLQNLVESDGKKLCKFGATLKAAVFSTPMDLFEFPRQQNDEKSEPEVMQFTASQKLLNPNMSASVSTTSTSEGQNQIASTMGQKNLKIHTTIFINNYKLRSGYMESEDHVSIQNLIQKIFDNAKISSENFKIKSFSVFSNKSNEYITVADDYFLDSLDKLELYLVKKEVLTPKIGIIQIGEKQQKLSVDPSNVETVKELAEFLLAKMDVKNGVVEVQMLDEDLGKYIPVNADEKFVESKTYKIKQAFEFDVVVQSDLTVTSSNVENKTESNVGFKNIEQEQSNTMPPSNLLLGAEPHAQPSLIMPISNAVASSGNPSDVVGEYELPVFDVNLESTKVKESPPKLPVAEDVNCEVSEVAVQHDSRKVLIQEYERKLDEFLGVPENTADLVNKVYSRELISILREIIKNLHTVPCPLSEEELKKIGISRASPMTTPGNRLAVRDRRGGSNNNSGTTSKSAPRPFIPSVMKSSAAVVADEEKQVEDGIQKLKNDVGNLLERLTQTNYKEILAEIIKKCDWKDANLIQMIADLVFDKAIKRTIYVDFYADLCLAIHKAEPIIEKVKRHFHGGIIRACQRSFDNVVFNKYQEKVTKLQAQLDDEESKEENDQTNIAKLGKEMENIIDMEKQRMIGLIKFISKLFRVGLLNYKITENCIAILIRKAEENGNEVMIEYAITLMKSVGPFVGPRKEDIVKIDGYVSYLEKFKTKVSTRVKFMIVELMELKEKKWIQKDDRPKTKEQIKSELKKEEKQKRLERAAFELELVQQNRTVMPEGQNSFC